MKFTRRQDAFLSWPVHLWPELGSVTYCFLSALVKHSKVPRNFKVLLVSPPTVPMAHQEAIYITLQIPSSPPHLWYQRTGPSYLPELSPAPSSFNPNSFSTLLTRLMFSLLLRCGPECREGGHQDILGTIVTLEPSHPPKLSSPTPVTPTASSSC